MTQQWYKGWRISRGSKPKFKDQTRSFVAVKGSVALVDESLPKLEARLDERKDELLAVRRPKRTAHTTAQPTRNVGGWTLAAVTELYKQRRPELP